MNFIQCTYELGFVWLIIFMLPDNFICWLLLRRFDILSVICVVFYENSELSEQKLMMLAFVRPLPPSVGKRWEWGHPSPLKNADDSNGWSLRDFFAGRLWSVP